MLRVTTAVVLTTVLGLNPAADPVGPTDGGASEVYRETLPGVAWVVTARPCGCGGAREFEGTAWVADVRNRLLVTNFHVVEGARVIRIYFPTADRTGRVATRREWYESNGPGIVGRVVAADSTKDLAVIQVAELPPGTKELRLADDSPEPGAAAHTVNNAGVNEALWAYANGTVRRVYPLVTRDGTFAGRVVESSVPSGPGASGSPVVNTSGEVIGVVFAGKRDSRPVTLSVDAVEVRLVLEAAGRAVANADPRLSPPARVGVDTDDSRPAQ